MCGGGCGQQANADPTGMPATPSLVDGGVIAPPVCRWCPLWWLAVAFAVGYYLGGDARK